MIEVLVQGRCLSGQTLCRPTQTPLHQRFTHSHSSCDTLDASHTVFEGRGVKDKSVVLSVHASGVACTSAPPTSPSHPAPPTPAHHTANTHSPQSISSTLYLLATMLDVEHTLHTDRSPLHTPTTTNPNTTTR